MDFTVRYGREEVSFSIADSRVKGVFLPRERAGLADPVAAMKEALAKPIGKPPLREMVSPGSKVAIVINDITRVVGTDVFLPFLLDELNAAGVPDDRITAVVATGIHRGHTPEEHRYIAGEEAYSRIKIVDHDAVNAPVSYYGRTSRGTPVYINDIVAKADFVILTGEVTYHMTAGYTGGRKSILPGVASLEAIETNHKAMVEPTATQGRLEGNVLHEDMLEAARMVKPNFIFNVVLNSRREFVQVVAGDMEQAHAEGCKLVDEMFAVNIEEKAEVVIATCGGYPKDINFYQAQKTLSNAHRAVRPGGTIILMAACPEGHGSQKFYDFMKDHSTPGEVVEAVAANFQMGHHKAYLTCRTLKEVHTILISEMPDEIVRVLMMEPAHSVEEALERVRARHGPDFQAYVLPEGFLTVPFVNS